MRLRLFPTLQAPSEARRALAPLAAQLDEASLADVRSVVSELVAISVDHGATRPIYVSLTFSEGSIEGIVYDEGPGARAIARARELRDDSLVLRIVERLVDDWGTNPHRTRIWFRLGVSPRAPARDPSVGDGAVGGGADGRRVLRHHPGAEG
jgi:anti-sigma regulatory factor (Ser/Thr protein kinase)